MEMLEQIFQDPEVREGGAQTKHFLYGAPENHDHYGLPVFCMDKR
jgi:hypothetical protein